MMGAEWVRPRLTARVVASWVASILALGISIYLTCEHYSGNSSLACPLGGGVVDCAKVTTSPQSVIFGIPVAVLGLAYYLPMVALLSPWAWWSRNRFVAPLRVGATIVSVGLISYLIYAELYLIHSICLWCSGVHLLTLVIFVLVVTGWDEAIAPFHDGAEEERATEKNR